MQPPGRYCAAHYGPSVDRVLLQGLAGPLVVLTLVLACYVSCGAALLGRLQGCSLADSFYFCCLSLASVGWGGLKPGPAAAPACAVYILVGQLLLATSAHFAYTQVHRIQHTFLENIVVIGRRVCGPTLNSRSMICFY